MGCYFLNHYITFKGSFVIIMGNTCIMHNSKAATCLLLGLRRDKVSRLSGDGAWSIKGLFSQSCSSWDRLCRRRAMPVRQKHCIPCQAQSGPEGTSDQQKLKAPDLSTSVQIYGYMRGVGRLISSWKRKKTGLSRFMDGLACAVDWTVTRQNSYVEALTPNRMIFRNGAFSRWLDETVKVGPP